jgi:glycosyltransferase involved in cell wall biosynthesis
VRILFATGESPWPARSGGDLRNVALVASLAQLGTVTTVLFPSSTPDAAVLPAGTVTYPVSKPKPIGWAVLRVRALISRRHHFTELLVRARAAETLRGEIARHAPDLVVLAFPLFGPIPAAVRGVPMLIVDVSELRGPLARRRLRTAVTWKGRIQAAVDLLTAAANEAGAFRLADAVWVSSDGEARAGASRRPRHVDTITNAIDIDAYRVYQGAARAPGSLAYVGSFDYEPNETAAVWLIDHVLPILRRDQPEAALVLIGRAPSARLRHACSEARVDLRGDVPDAMAELAGTDMLVVGLQSGGGTRLKILEAWAAGIPVVSTSIGIEGLEHAHRVDVLVADTPEQVAAAVVELWESAGLRDALIRGGAERVASRYGLERVADDVRTSVEALAR